MNFTKEKIKLVLENYDYLYDKISDIVSLHGKLDDCFYHINEIEYFENFLSVNVEYYKWQDTNYKTIPIDLNLLIDKESFNIFNRTVSEKVAQDKLLKEEQENKENAKKIQDAIKLLKDNGIKLD